MKHRSKPLSPASFMSAFTRSERRPFRWKCVSLEQDKLKKFFTAGRKTARATEFLFVIRIFFSSCAVITFNSEIWIIYKTQRELVPYPWLSHPATLIIIFICVVGNISIFALVCLSKTFRRPSNYLIANLCVASVYFIAIFTFYNIRSEGFMHYWEYSPIVCSSLGVIQRLCVPVVPYNIMLISLDRSLAARNPLDHATTRTIIIRIVSIWLLGLAVVLPRGIINQYDEHSVGSYKCKKVLLGGSPVVQTVYAIIVLTLVYLIPFYILIKEFITLRSKMKFLTLSQVEQKKRFQHRLRLMQNSCIFTAIFITCWLPQGVFQFPFDLPSEMTEKFSQYLLLPRDVSRQVALLNTCLNPILLLLLSFDVREYLASCSLV